MTQPRLVLDTNVLLSALLFHDGSLSWLRHSWQSETIRPLASRDTAEELIRVLAYPKFHLTEDEREDLLALKDVFSIPILTPAAFRDRLPASNKNNKGD